MSTGGATAAVPAAPADTHEPAAPPDVEPAPKPPAELEGQVFSEKQIKTLQTEANSYATTKSVTQVIFTTSAIASNVTLWNQLTRNTRHFAALNALIWVSVALNIFVILLATYLSFQRPKDPPKASDAADGSPGASGVVAHHSHAAGAAKPPRGTRMHRPTSVAIPAGKLDAEDPEPGKLPADNGHQPPAGPGVKGGCCWSGVKSGCRWARGACTHQPYDGDAVELCGCRVYSRTNADPSWACCDLGCCAVFRVTGTGKALGILSVNPSKKNRRQFMDAKNNFLNEVIGILAVAIVIMNVIISAIAPK